MADRPTPARGDLVAFDRDGVRHRKIVQHTWNESADDSPKRGPMVVVNYGGGSVSIPVSTLFMWKRRDDLAASDSEGLGS